MRHSSLAQRIGRAVRQLRNERTTLSQEALADVIGVHRTYLGVLERGIGNPTVDTLERVARALGVSVSEIVRRAEGMRAARSRTRR
jgi:transcriptional regulator with XRE-family HTH domain